MAYRGSQKSKNRKIGDVFIGYALSKRVKKDGVGSGVVLQKSRGRKKAKIESRES